MAKGNFRKISTRSRFDQLLEVGDIQPSYVCFIEDTQEVWTQGMFLVSDAPNDGLPYLRKSGKWNSYDIPSLVGEWVTGTSVPALGIVTMGGVAFMAKVATNNPPIFVFTDADESRLTYLDGEYVITGELNLDEYEILVRNGAKGDTGEQGPQGEKGEKGDTGEQGPQGEKGDKGDKGDAGEQGPQGEKGAKGDTGEQGPQGEKGDKGDTGEQGLQGEKGDGFSLHGNWGTGSSIPYLGITTMGGQAFASRSATSNPPLWCYTDKDGGRLLLNDDDYMLTGESNVTDYMLLVSDGAKGDRGEKGDKGDTGEQGPQGEKGDKGDKGDTGEQGSQGEKGDKGDTGEQGPQGEKGDKGDKGDTGEQGPQGPTGLIGEEKIFYSSGNEVGGISGDDDTYMFWAGGSRGYAPFSVSKDGEMKSDSAGVIMSVKGYKWKRASENYTENHTLIIGPGRAVLPGSHYGNDNFSHPYSIEVKAINFPGLSENGTSSATNLTVAVNINTVELSDSTKAIYNTITDELVTEVVLSPYRMYTFTLLPGHADGRQVWVME